MSTAIEQITSQIYKGEGLTPFLFISENLELLHSEVHNISTQLLKNYQIPLVELFCLEDNGNAIKIKDIKDFIKVGEMSSPYKMRIFIIENISRMTLSSFNSCLKFFEEPGIQNIIFLTNASEGRVLDTILSRVQVINLGFTKIGTQYNFYFSLIDSYLNTQSSEIFSYFFNNKLEKDEGLEFLSSLIFYSKTQSVYFSFLGELEEDILLISTNNVNVKPVIDKYLLLL